MTTDLGIPFLRNSERLAFKQCQYKWHFAWNMGLVPAIQPQNARWFGSCLHIALAEHYTPPKGKPGTARGRDMQETWAEITQDTYVKISTQGNWDDEQEKVWVDAIELGAAMLAGYAKEYKGDPHWEVLMPEQRFEAYIAYTKDQLRRLINTNAQNIPEGKFITKLVGSLDLPVRNLATGHIEIVDHKSSGRKMGMNFLTKDDQIGTYIAVTKSYLAANGLIKDTDEIRAVVFNYLKKTLPPDPEKVHPDGTVRNKPGKRDYIAAIMGIDPDAIDSLEEDRAMLFGTLEKISIAKLAAKLPSDQKVWGPRSANQPGKLFWREVIPRSRANRIRQQQRIAEDAEVMARIRAGDVPLLKSPGEHCNWCEFNDLCDIDENGDDMETYIKDVFRVQDPYADHRPDAINSKITAGAKKESGVW